MTGKPGSAEAEQATLKGLTTLVAGRGRTVRSALAGRYPATPTTSTRSKWYGANVKATELANLCPDTVDEAHTAAQTGQERIGGSYQLRFNFLDHTGLSL